MRGIGSLWSAWIFMLVDVFRHPLTTSWSPPPINRGRAPFGLNIPHGSCTLYSVLCTLVTGSCTLYSVLCTLKSGSCTLYSVLCTLITDSCTLYSVLCTLKSGSCTLYSVICTLSYISTSATTSPSKRRTMRSA